MAEWVIELERDATNGWWRGNARRPNDRHAANSEDTTPQRVLERLGDYITMEEIGAQRERKKVRKAG